MQNIFYLSPRPKSPGCRGNLIVIEVFSYPLKCVMLSVQPENSSNHLGCFGINFYVKYRTTFSVQSTFTDRSISVRRMPTPPLSLFNSLTVSIFNSFRSFDTFAFSLPITDICSALYCFWFLYF